MKRLPNTILLAVLFFGLGLFAQEVSEDSPAVQDRVEQIVEDVLETAVDAVENSENNQAGVEEASPEADANTATSEEDKAEELVQAQPVEAVPVEETDWIYRGDMVMIGSDNYLGPNEKSKDIVTIAGNSKIEGYVDGDAVTVLGNSEVTGTVDGDYVVVMGSSKLGPNAKVEGDAVVIGGKLDIHPQAKVDGEHVNIPFFPPGAIDHFHEVPLFVRECIFLARPISPDLKLTLYIAGVFLLFYLLLAALFPKPLERSRMAIEEKPFNSFFAGVLVMACFIPFIIILLITVVGALLIPIAGLALLAVAIFGKAVALFFIGKQIARAIRISVLENAMLSILIGGIIVYALYMIPFFGLFLWLVLSLLGLGAVCIAIGTSISERKAERMAAMPTRRPESGPPPLAGESEGETSYEAAYPSEPVAPGTSLDQVDNATAAIFPRVGFWWRALATLIDLILVSVVTNVLNIGTPIIPLFGYFIIFWGWKSSTLGGMALGLRVQKVSGEPLDWSAAIVRSLSSIVSFLPFLIGFFWAGWDPEHQSWHDKIAGTTVVQIPKGYTWS